MAIPPPFDWVGSRITFFEACTAFTVVTACGLAESLNDPFHRKLRLVRHLTSRSGCYGLERQLPGGIALPLWKHKYHGAPSGVA